MPGKLSRYLYHKAMPSFVAVLLMVAAAGLGGCFYPPPPAAKPKLPNHQVIQRAYDVTWDATVKVVTNLGYHVVVKDPVHGIIEMQGEGFSLDDANCGVVGTVAGKQIAYPSVDATAVFNISLVPHGDEATDVTIQATYTTPVEVPFHPKRDFTCVSTGSRESIILRKIAAQAAKIHRPIFKPPTGN